MILHADGFEEALLGHAQQFNKEFAVYDRAMCIKILARDMPLDEAEEFFEYNVIGAYVGEFTPAFLTLKEDDYDDFNI